MTDFGIQDMIDAACGDRPVVCADCGRTYLESQICYWEEKRGGMSFDVPVCVPCFDERDRRELAYTRLRIEQTGKVIAIGFAIGAFLFVVGYGLYVTLESLQGLF